LPVDALQAKLICDVEIAVAVRFVGTEGGVVLVTTACAVAVPALLDAVRV
jgi:hypothetical protein